jgi:hypothetical protein
MPKCFDNVTLQFIKDEHGVLQRRLLVCIRRRWDM